jgi:hypothetical protein
MGQLCARVRERVPDHRRRGHAGRVHARDRVDAAADQRRDDRRDERGEAHAAAAPTAMRGRAHDG